MEMNTSRGRPPQKTGLHRDLKTLAYIVTAPFSTQKLIRNVTSRNSQVLKKKNQEMAFIISSCELIIYFLKTFRPV